MPALRRIDAAARLIAVIPAFILTKGKAAAKHEQCYYRHRQDQQAHRTPPLILLGSRECHHASMSTPWPDQGIFMRNN